MKLRSRGYIGHRLLPLQSSTVSRGARVLPFFLFVSLLGGLAHAFTTPKSGCPALLAFFARGRGF
jgi:hypothetical protein